MTVAACFARVAGRFSLVLLAGLAAAGCSFTTDFDAPYPGDAAVSVSVCERDCRATIGCLGDLECPKDQFPDVLARFEGYCQADCSARNDQAFIVRDCKGSVALDLLDWYGDAYTSTCEATEPLCVAYCEGAGSGGDVTSSFFGECVDRSTIGRGLEECMMRCGELGLDFWRCVGAAEQKNPQRAENDQCEIAKTCYEAHEGPQVTSAN